MASLSNKRYVSIVVIFILIEATGVFEQVMMYTAVPTFMRVFSLNTESVSWAITIFLLVGTGIAPLSGRLGDSYGRRKALLIGIVIAIVGFGGFAIAVHNLPLAITATFFTGLGTSFILAGLPTMIVETVKPENTGEAVGIVYQVGRTLFSAVGTALTGVILSSSVVPKTTAPTLVAWHSIIVFIAATAILAFAVTLFVRKATPMDQRDDLVEAVGELSPEEGEALQPAPPPSSRPATA
jgi:MFS family permease